MTEPAGSERTERLQQELAQAREQRDRLAVDGTVVTLRFPDGDVATYRIVAIPEENGDDVVTAGSPLGQALVGRGVGDAISYQGPDGELHAEVVSVRAP